MRFFWYSMHDLTMSTNIYATSSSANSHRRKMMLVNGPALRESSRSITIEDNFVQMERVWWLTDS